MSKIPRSPDEIFSEFTADAKKLFGDDLISIVLFGSGAKGDYIHKKSDINFLIILSKNGLDSLHKGFSLVKKWTARKVSVPLFLDKEYIQSSLDSFSIEFLNLQEHHRVVYGEDVLSSLQIEKENLRLQCETQVKGKLLHLREEFLKTMGNKKSLQQLLSATIPAFATIFTALLYIKGVEPPKLNMELILTGVQQFGLDQQIFKKVLLVKERREKFSSDELVELTQKYIHEIRNLATVIDKM